MLKDQAIREAVCGIQDQLEVLGDLRTLNRLNVPDSRLGHTQVDKKLRQLKGKECFQVGVIAIWPMSGDQVVQIGKRTYTFSARDTDQLDDCDFIFINWNYFYGKSEKLHEITKLTHNDEGRPCVAIIWLIDHHHEFKYSLKLAFEFDFYVHAHPTRIDYLHSLARNCLGFLPCCSGQWHPAQVEAFATKYMSVLRTDSLYGGFNGYNSSFAREDFIRKAIEHIPNNDLFIVQCGEPNENHRYFSKTGEERFHEWCRYKTSAVLAVNEDIPIRLFDALVAGQIPIVSDDIQSLEMVLSPNDQLNLPVLRYRAGDIDSLAEAHREAVRLFDKDGPAGFWRRHKYAVEMHSFAPRLRTLAEMLELKIVASSGCGAAQQNQDQKNVSLRVAVSQTKDSISTLTDANVSEEVRAGAPMLLPKLSDELERIRSHLAIAEHRVAAMHIVLRALIVSLRPFGLNRRRFKRCVHEEGQETPNDGFAAIRHTVLHQEARRVLREIL